MTRGFSFLTWTSEEKAKIPGKKKGAYESAPFELDDFLQIRPFHFEFEWLDWFIRIELVDEVLRAYREIIANSPLLPIFHKTRGNGTGHPGADDFREALLHREGDGAVVHVPLNSHSNVLGSYGDFDFFRKLHIDILQSRKYIYSNRMSIEIPSTHN